MHAGRVGKSSSCVSIAGPQAPGTALGIHTPCAAKVKAPIAQTEFGSCTINAGSSSTVLRAPDTPKKLKNAIDRMLLYTAKPRLLSLRMERTAATASSSGMPLLSLTRVVTGSTKQHSSRPQQPSRPTASSAGTCTYMQ